MIDTENGLANLVAIVANRMAAERFGIEIFESINVGYADAYFHLGDIVAAGGNQFDSIIVGVGQSFAVGYFGRGDHDGLVSARATWPQTVTRIHQFDD